MCVHARPNPLKDAIVNRNSRLPRPRTVRLRPRPDIRISDDTSMVDPLIEDATCEACSASILSRTVAAWLDALRLDGLLQFFHDTPPRHSAASATETTVRIMRPNHSGPPTTRQRRSEHRDEIQRASARPAYRTAPTRRHREASLGIFQSSTSVDRWRAARGRQP